MAIRLVVIDLDGTLLDQRHQISAENAAAIRAAAAKGVTVTIATGRMYASALPYARQLEVDAPIITYNGALIRRVSGKVIAERFLDPEAAGEIAAFCRQKGWYLQSYAQDRLYFAERCQKSDDYEAQAGLKGTSLGERFYALKDGVPKMLIITDSEAQTDAYIEEFRAKFGARAFAAKSNPTYIEIVHPQVNKAAALEILMNKLGIARREEVMAIGDSGNDAPMLKAAGWSVAMGNAAPNIQALCDCVTADCAHSGVAAAIGKYVLETEKL